MDYIKKHALLIAAVLIGTLVAAYFVFAPAPAAAADLGGNCCADLEERIAELEATTARKGNRKVSLTVSGQINKALMHIDVDEESDFYIKENSNAESFVSFAGEARISPDWTAGYVLEIGVGGYEDGIVVGQTNDLYTRRSYLYVESARAGRVSLGLSSQATDGIAEISVANTHVVSRMLTLRPLTGPDVGDAADIFDGTRGNLVRYDTPVWAGFVASAAWAPGDDDSEVWDLALRYAGEAGGFRLGAGIGYRSGIVIPSFGAGFGDDVDVISGSASVMHIDSGLFLNGAYGDLDAGNVASLSAWHLQGGIERKWNSLGKTTIFAEYADASDIDLTLYGGGIVQAIDSAGLDLYANIKQYKIDGANVQAAPAARGIAVDTDEDATLLMFGARIRF